MVIDCSLPVPLSLADTCTMPLASRSKVTSTCGMPRGAGAMPVSSKVPRFLLSRVNSRSPWKTWMATDGWLSSAVVKVSLRLVGMAVLRSMRRVMMPPLVSMPRLSGVTSMSRTSLRSPFSTPAWSAAPTATTSSGLTPLFGSLPPVSALTSSYDGGHAGGATDEHDVGDVVDLDAGFTDDVLERLLGAVEQVFGHLLELGAGERLVEVGRAVLRQREVGQLDAGGHARGEFLLGLLRGFLEALLGDLVLGDVDAGGVLEALDQVIDDALVPVVAAEAVVAGGRAHLDGGEVVVLAHLEEGDVEGSATEVEDQDELVFLAAVEAVGQGGRGGLVDDAQHVEAGDLAGFLGGLALGVVEVRGNGDDGIRHLVAQVLLGVALELGEDAGGDLLRGVLLVVDGDGPVRCPRGA